MFTLYFTKIVDHMAFANGQSLEWCSVIWIQIRDFLTIEGVLIFHHSILATFCLDTKGSTPFYGNTRPHEQTGTSISRKTVLNTKAKSNCKCTRQYGTCDDHACIYFFFSRESFLAVQAQEKEYQIEVAFFPDPFKFCPFILIMFLLLTIQGSTCSHTTSEKNLRNQRPVCDWDI